MGLRKFKADFLFDGIQILPAANVLVTNTEGKFLDIVSEEDAGEEVQNHKGLISPAFINSHCHLELSYLKGIIPENTGLVDFILNVVSLRDFNIEAILEAIEDAELEMVNNGIAALGDICNTGNTLIQKEKRNLAYYNFIEVSGWLPQGAASRLKYHKVFYEEYLKNGGRASMVPHAPYSVCNELWDEMIPLFAEKVVSIHNQETPHENMLFLEGRGDFTRMYDKMNIDNSYFVPPKIKSLPAYFEKLSQATSVILVHNTCMMQDDIDFIRKHRAEGQLVSFCLCPNANLYIENKLPPVNLLMQNNAHIVLGTDSLASNHQLNILEEIKTIARHFPEIPTATMLGWATLNGARALKMEDHLGSFEKDKTPGVILIDNLEEGKITKDSKVTNLWKAV